MSDRLKLAVLASLLIVPFAVHACGAPGHGRAPKARGLDLSHPEWSYSQPDLAVDSDGTAALVWLAFDGRRDRVLAALSERDGWGAPLEVSAGAGELFAPVVAPAGKGEFWIVWPAREAGGWDLFARRVIRGALGPLERLTADAAPDTAPALAVSPDGRPWVAWQSEREGGLDVLFARRTASGWSKPARATRHPASDFQPALTFDGAGRPWVAWSSWRDGSYVDGNYEVYARCLDPREPGEAVRVSRSGRADLFPRFAGTTLVWTESAFSARPLEELTTVAYDSWRDKSYRAAELGENGFGAPRSFAVPERVVVSDFAAPVRAPVRAPAGGAGGALWLVHQTLVDRPVMEKSWRTAWHPGGREAPRATGDPVTGPGGRFDAGWVGGRLIAVATAGSPGRASWLRVFELDPAAAELAAPIVGRVLPVHDPARATDAGRPAERAEVRSGGRTLRSYHGNLHLHSDLSSDGRGHEGTPELNYQVVHDLAALDFAGLSDHVEWFHAGDWWTVRKLADLWNRPGRFVTLPGYEWTSFRHGHRNVYFAGAKDADEDAAVTSFGRTPADLWAALGERAALTIPHHPSHRVNRPLDWSFRSDRFQRLVEIFQVRGSSEFDGAAYQRGTEGSNFAPGHSVREALARGHRLGIVASPDHGGGLGLAGAWADELTREALFEALFARRTFGTTGARMDLWLTVAGAPQGSEVECDGGSVAVHAEVNGTAEGLTLTLVSDGADLRSWDFEGRRAVMDWADERPLGVGARYYYLRARQGDGHLGWSSPVWVVRGR